MNLRPPRSGSMNSGGGSLLHSSPNQISPGKQSIKRVIKLDGVFSSFKFALAFSQESKFQFLPKRQIFHRQPIHSRPQLRPTYYATSNYHTVYLTTGQGLPYLLSKGDVFSKQAQKLFAGSFSKIFYRPQRRLCANLILRLTTGIRMK